VKITLFLMTMYDENAADDDEVSDDDDHYVNADDSIADLH